MVCRYMSATRNLNVYFTVLIHGQGYIHISTYGSTALVDLGRFFLQFINLYTVGRTPWTGVQAVARPLPTHRTTQTQNKRTQTSMPRVEFEPTAPVFEQAKTVYALNCAATMVGCIHIHVCGTKNRVRIFSKQMLQTGRSKLLWNMRP
jgi:hypothetical protein